MNTIVKHTECDYNTSLKIIEELQKNFPFLSTEVQGRTALSRGIFSLSIGNKQNSVLLAGGFHGSERITASVLYLFTERLCRSISSQNSLCGIDIKKALTHLGVTIIPCVNPDGTEISIHGPEGAKSLRHIVEDVGCENYEKWNANALGVDINHNFNAGWDILRQMEQEKGITGPAPRQFGGAYPESEAETKTLTRLCRIRKFRSAMAVHSQGRELFWHYGENTPPQSAMMAKILAGSCSYSLIDNAGLYSHGGFKDWFINEMKSPAFTIEIGKGENPLPIGELYNIYSEIEEALVLFCLM